MSDVDLTGKRVLLLGSNERAALSVCRSLGRAGALVDIVGFEAVRQPAELSRYCRKRYYFGAPQTDPSGVAAQLLQHLDAVSYDAIFPITDLACELVFAHHAALSARTAIIGPDPEAYVQAVDKANAVDLAGRVGLQAPESLLLRYGDDPSAAFAWLKDGPIYVKPTRSCLLRDGFAHAFDVKKCVRAEQLERKLAEDLPRVPVLVQKPVAGHGVGLNFLADRGRLVAATKNERLHEPPDGGGSSLRRNLPLTARDLQVMRDIAAAVQWSGLIMVEVKQDGDDLTIMEMNCRPWGSIETAIRAGVDFPVLAVALALGMTGASDTVVRSDKLAVVRNFKNDLRWVVGQRRRWFARPSPLWEWLSAPLRAWRGHEHFDIEQSDDVMPAVGQLNPVFCRIWHKVRLAVLLLTTRFGHRHQFQQLKRDAPIMFLCQGNINRSAVADILYRQAGFTNVRSSGVLPFEGRGISPAAARFLEAQGIDHAQHRSSHFRAEDAQPTDETHIVVFDYRTKADLLLRYPQARSRIILMDNLSKTPIGEVRDPHGEAEADYQACFGRITASLADQIG